mmetsp:Transcript_50356/g.133715  ORF Transcript_50356/g.133715 Transcript_50356/m.133715 type:complete len:201 (-) Transcript_50356:703-1305(-)
MLFASCGPDLVVLREDVGSRHNIEVLGELALHPVNIFPQQVFSAHLPRRGKVVRLLVGVETTDQVRSWHIAPQEREFPAAETGAVEHMAQSVHHSVVFMYVSRRAVVIKHLRQRREACNLQFLVSQDTALVPRFPQVRRVVVEAKNRRPANEDRPQQLDTAPWCLSLRVSCRRHTHVPTAEPGLLHSRCCLNRAHWRTCS